jgi:hypothetical protein
METGASFRVPSTEKSSRESRRWKSACDPMAKKKARRTSGVSRRFRFTEKME